MKSRVLQGQWGGRQRIGTPPEIAAEVEGVGMIIAWARGAAGDMTWSWGLAVRIAWAWALGLGTRHGRGPLWRRHGCGCCLIFSL